MTSTFSPIKLKAPIQTAIVVAFCLIVGCGESVLTKSLPAPIRDEVVCNLVGEIERVWGGDHFEFGDREQLHYILIRGVDSPKYSQKFYSQARHATMDWTRGKEVRIEVVARDEMMTEIADVFVINREQPELEMNVGLELVKQGLGWFDENEFEGASEFRKAQEEAKANRVGLWSEENPVPPWEFESSTHKTILDKLKL